MARSYSIGRNRWLSQAAIAVATALMCLTASGQNKRTATVAQAQEKPITAGYVGSQECALCHPDIYEKYSRTDMGRSMAAAGPAALVNISTSASIVDQRLNRRFELFVRDGKVYQSEYALTEQGKELFRDTRKIDWILGAGQNGLGAIVQQ